MPNSRPREKLTLIHFIVCTRFYVVFGLDRLYIENLYVSLLSHALVVKWTSTRLRILHFSITRIITHDPGSATSFKVKVTGRWTRSMIGTESMSTRLPQSS
jgi:hypothetical protein